MKIFEQIEENEDKIVVNDWIEWYHFGIPKEEGLLRELIRIAMLIFSHCLICTKLTGCYFVKRKMPTRPMHEMYHCKELKINSWIAKQKINAECDIRKFTEYIFKNGNSKKKIFESWGFNINDSYALKKEFEKQAENQYKLGNYILKNLDISGQRVAISMDIKGNKFLSGWMIYPAGKIKNITPFGGWINEKI